MNVILATALTEHVEIKKIFIQPDGTAKEIIGAFHFAIGYGYFPWT